MGRYVNVSTWIDVDVDLEEVDTDDLIAELQSRNEYVEGMEPEDIKEVVERIWLKRRNGQPYEQDIDTLIYNVLGKVI